MSPRPGRKIPELAVPRLSLYYRALIEAEQDDVISSEELARLTGHSAAQVRRDLAYFGQFGRPGLGYAVEGLRKALLQILGLDRQWNVVLVGVGNLGEALLGYKGFRRQGFKLVAAFDLDKKKAGRSVEGVPVLSVEDMPRVINRDNVRMAILTVPQAAAQKAADDLVKCGVRAILNFAPLRLSLPDPVTVHNIDVALELEKLTFLARWRQGRMPRGSFRK